MFMVINFYRLYGIIFYTIDKEPIKCIYNANTHEDLARAQRYDYRIEADYPLSDRQAREWFKEHYPNLEIHKINKHYHTEQHFKEDRMGD